MNGSRVSSLLSFVLVVMSACVEHAAAQDIAGRLRLEARVQGATAYYRTSSNAPNEKSYGVSLGGSESGGLGSLSGAGPINALGIGYAIDEHWMPSIAGSVSQAKRPDSDLRTSTYWSLRPGLTYVFAEGHKLRPFVGASLGYGHSNFAGFEGTDVGAALITGAQLHVLERLSLEPFVQAQYSHSSLNGGTSGALTVSDWEIDSVDLQGGFMLALWI